MFLERFGKDQTFAMLRMTGFGKPMSSNKKRNIKPVCDKSINVIATMENLMI